MAFSSEHFSEGELSCHCCGGFPENGIDDNLLSLLEDVRNAVGEAITVNCVYRCPSHNAEVGGVPNSQHVLGTAADVDVTSLSISVDQLADIAVSLNADGVGRYDNFVHMDVRDGRVGSGYAWDER